jgi:hypothetical protein
MGTLDTQRARVIGSRREIGTAPAQSCLRAGAAAHGPRLDVRQKAQPLPITADVGLSCGRLGVVLNPEASIGARAARHPLQLRPLLGSGPEGPTRTSALAPHLLAQRSGTAGPSAGESAFESGAEISIDGGLLAGPVAIRTA